MLATLQDQNHLIILIVQEMFACEN